MTQVSLQHVFLKIFGKFFHFDSFIAFNLNCIIFYYILESTNNIRRFGIAIGLCGNCTRQLMNVKFSFFHILYDIYIRKILVERTEGKGPLERYWR